MAFPLKDVRVTTRRPAGSGDGALPILYPRLLRDGACLPKIAIAVNYFEAMLGKERREFDPELLVQFFGDHKLARSIVASLARRYRYRTPPLEEVVKPGALVRLRKAKLDHPRLLRLHVYDLVNASAAAPAGRTHAAALLAGAGAGFLPAGDHAGLHGVVERRLRLRRGDLDRLLHLDADEHAVLTRIGPTPAPAEVLAFYNYDALDTLLRRAEQIDLAIAGLSEPDSAGIRATCAAEGVAVEVRSGIRGALVRLRGRQDSMGLWSRHGRRVARAAVRLVQQQRPSILDAGALVALKHKRALLKLTPELLAMLDLPEAAEPARSAGAVA